MDSTLPEVASCEQWRQLHRQARASHSVSKREIILEVFHLWETLYGGFRKAEDASFYSEEGPSKSDLFEHRSAIVLLLARGEELRIPLIALGLEDELFKLKTISDAMQESLALWHPVNPIEPSAKEAIRSLFLRPIAVSRPR